MNAPAWKLEYPSLESEAFLADLSAARALLAQLEKIPAPSEATTVEKMQETLLLREEAGILLSNLSTYTMCLFAEDSRNQQARGLSSEIEALSSRLSQAVAPLLIHLQRCPEELFTRVIAHPALRGNEFVLRRQRLLAPHLLSPAEEVLLKAFGVPGHQAWGNLYDDISGSGKCTLLLEGGQQTLGLSEAQGLVYGPDEKKREAAWKAVDAFWDTQLQSSAAIVNALAGWRIELAKKRSLRKARGFLDQALFDNHVTEATLNALIESCRRNLPALRRAPLLMARTMGKKKLDPWDTVASCPISGGGASRPFGEGMKMVKEGFRGIDPSMGEFAEMMLKNQWIEARALPNKGGGAFCTGFAKSLEPRVFQTYLGSMSDVMTLAHELGHAFHSWVMRDLPRGEQDYPSTLAETASVFAETAVRDHLLEASSSWEEKVEAAWNDVESTAGYLVNIPARFEFEKKFHELRKESFVSAEQLCDLSDSVWSDWYGETLSANDRKFWAHKMHFSFAGSGFYNFPYAFGYLFSLSIYARRGEKGFFTIYRDILRDTGRMTAEDLVRKHLGEDIEKPEFWQKALDLVILKLDRYENLLNSR